MTDFGGSVGAEDEILGVDEILGLDEIIGAEEYAALGYELDDDEFVGGRRSSAGRRAHLARRMQVAREINPSARLIRERQRSRVRRLILPIPKTNVLAGQSVNISIQPQDLFKTTRMLIPSDIAFDFEILDLKIGQRPQFVQSGSIPAAVFSEVSVGSSLDLDSADIGNIVSIEVRNKSAVALDFSGTLLGTAAK